jgi:hypothetical protein
LWGFTKKIKKKYVILDEQCAFVLVFQLLLLKHDAKRKKYIVENSSLVNKSGGTLDFKSAAAVIREKNMTHSQREKNRVLFLSQITADSELVH